ncbi:MAG: low affinity iron permease family protein [Sphingomonas sp.]
MLRKIIVAGGRISDAVANLAGHPLSMATVILFCAGWLEFGGAASENALTLFLSVAAISLTQMVLNQQKRNEAALHLKIDELILAKNGARNELAGIEGATEEELENLRRTANTGAERVS